MMTSRGLLAIGLLCTSCTHGPAIRAGGDFPNLAPHYEGQKTDSSCSLASTTMVLNALQRASGRGVAPVSQETVLAKAGPAWAAAVANGGTGLTLDQLRTQVGETLRDFGFSHHGVIAVHTGNAGAETLAAFKKDLLENEQSEKVLMIANFDQAAIFGGAPSGHFAPIGSYDAANDRVLIMDPDRELYEPFWVSSSKLLHAMTGTDSDSKRSRGYLIVRVK